MIDSTRVIGYKKSKIMSDDDLIAVAGGAAAKVTGQLTHKITGVYPAQLDWETDQIWD